jgi:hypothetical protein
MVDDPGQVGVEREGEKASGLAVGIGLRAGDRCGERAQGRDPFGEAGWREDKSARNVERVG